MQLADFLAFIINGSTHLYMKKNRTDVDEWFLEMFSSMNINCEDLTKTNVTGELSDFTVEDFDKTHENDRHGKGVKFP